MLYAQQHMCLREALQYLHASISKENTYNGFEKAMSDVHKKFKIQNKIVCTVMDTLQILLKHSTVLGKPGVNNDEDQKS